jgi:class 3 adenylate cyclase
VDRSPEDLREVSNYVVALEHGISRLRKLPLCVRLTRELHEKLMISVQGRQAAPGRFVKFRIGLASLEVLSQVLPTSHLLRERSSRVSRLGRSSCMNRTYRLW